MGDYKDMAEENSLNDDVDTLDGSKKVRKSSVICFTKEGKFGDIDVIRPYSFFFNSSEKQLTEIINEAGDVDKITTLMNLDDFFTLLGGMIENISNIEKEEGYKGIYESFNTFLDKTISIARGEDFELDPEAFSDNTRH